MRSVGMIACDHGLGHVRRCLLISAELARRGLDVTLFAPRKSVQKLSHIHDEKVRITDFSTLTTAAALREGRDESKYWHRRLPDVQSFDLVVSDNLPEILEVRNDAILSGGFLWHQALPDMDAEMISTAQGLMAEYCPPMITSRLFASAELLSVCRPHQVGLYVSEECVTGSGTDLLIAAGSVTDLDEHYRQALERLSKQGSPEPFPSVWVEERLMPNNPPAWMKKASFGPDLYSRIAACVCRPGVGTLTDALCAGARVFCVYEDGNEEMHHNAQQMVKAGVGQACATPDLAVDAAQAFAGNVAARQRHSAAIGGIEFNGVHQCADLLMSMAA